jgi:hypothetical protein
VNGEHAEAVPGENNAFVLTGRSEPGKPLRWRIRI